MKCYIINLVDGSNATKYQSFEDLKKLHNIPDSDWESIKMWTNETFEPCNYAGTCSEFVAYAKYFLDTLNTYLNMNEFESPYGDYQYTLIDLEEDYLEI